MVPVLLCTWLYWYGSNCPTCVLRIYHKHPIILPKE